MIILTHTVITIGVGKFFGAKTLWDWFLAFLFGVLIDLDHLKIFRPKHLNNGDWGKFLTRELPIRSFLQEPIFIFFVVPLSFFLNNPLPMAAWAAHVFLDYLVDGAKKPLWPLSNLTFKKGIFPTRSIWEILLIFVLLLFFFGGQVV